MTKRLKNILVLALLAILIFMLSLYIQWYGDSYHYRFSFNTGEPITSFWEIFPSQYAHYFLMNGRVWVHVLCQGFSALWGQTAFAICNAVVYVVFVLLMLRLCGGNWRNLKQLLTAVLLVLFFCDLSYNANCQIGYIWVSTVTIAFIIEYFRGRELKRCGIWSGIWLFILGLLAGNGNETISIGVGAALIVDFGMHWRRLTSRQWILLIGFGIGGLLVCLSPGIRTRAGGTSSDVIWTVIRVLSASRALYLMIFTLTVLKIRREISLRIFAVDNLFYVVGMISLLLLNVLIGINSQGRQLFGVELFAAILTLKAVRDCSFTTTAIWLLAIIVAGQYALKFDYLRKSNADLGELRCELEKNGDRTAYVDFQRYPSFVRPTEMNNSIREYVGEACALSDDIDNYASYYPHTGKESCQNLPQVYPTAAREALQREDPTTALKCADGFFLLIDRKESPKKFIIERDYCVMGLRFRSAPFVFEIPDYNMQNIGDIRIYYQNFEKPFTENVSIRIAEE